jgi:hypothetical protein
MTTIWLGDSMRRPTVAWEAGVGARVALEAHGDVGDRVLTILGGDGPPLCGRHEGLLIRPMHADLDRIDEHPGDVFLHRIPVKVWDDLVAGRRETWSLDDLLGNVGGCDGIQAAASREELPPSAEQRVTGYVDLLTSWVDDHGSLEVPFGAMWDGRRIGVILHNMSSLADRAELHPDDQAALAAVPGWPGQVVS